MKRVNHRSNGWNVSLLFSLGSDAPHAHSCEKPIQHLFCNDPAQGKGNQHATGEDSSHANQPFHSAVFETLLPCGT